MAMKLTEGYIDLTVQDARFQRTMLTVEAKLRAVQASMMGVSRAAKTMLLIGTAAIGASVKVFASFQKQMQMISTMLDEQSMKYMPEYERAISELAMKFGEGTKTISKGLYDILSASIAPAQALDLLRIAMKAGIGGMTDTAVAADAITTILNAYGYAAQYAERVSDVLFAIVKRGKTTFEELASRIGMVTAVANLAGVSFEEVGAAIATLTRSGIQADKAITALRAIINGFLKPTGDAAKAARMFGFELNTSTIKSIGLLGVLKKLKTATPEQVAEIFPNIRALTGLATALQNATGYMKDHVFILNRARRAEEAFRKMAQGTAFTVQRLWQSIKMTSRELGEQFEPVILKVSNALIALLKPFREWIKEHGAAIVKVTLLIGACSLFLVIVPKIISGLLGLIGVLKILRIAFSTAFLAGLLPLAPIIGLLGVIGGSLYALRAAWKQNFMGMKDMFQEWLNKIKEGWIWLANNAIGPAYEWMVKEWKKIWPELKKDLHDFGNDLIAFFAGVGAVIAEALKEPLKGGKELGETFAKAFVETWEKDIAGMIGSKIKAGGTFLVEKLKGVSDIILEMGTEVWDSMQEFFSGYWNVIKEQLEKDIEAFLEWIENKLPQFKKTFDKFRETIQESLKFPEVEFPKIWIPKTELEEAKIKLGFTDIKSMWKEMAVAMNREKEQGLQRSMLHEQKNLVSLQEKTIQETRSSGNRTVQAIKGVKFTENTLDE